MNKKPKIQNAITLERFFVPNVEMNFNSIIDEETIETISIEIEFGIGYDENTKDIYSTNFEINIQSENKELFLKLTAIAFFKTSNEIDKEFLESNFVQVNSPAIAFPFIRSYINTITTNSGIPPIILPSFNFSSKKK